MTPILTIVRNPPTLVVYFDDPRAAMRFGEEYRLQRLYFGDELEAIDWAWDHALDGGPVRIEEA